MSFVCLLLVLTLSLFDVHGSAHSQHALDVSISVDPHIDVSNEPWTSKYGPQNDLGRESHLLAVVGLNRYQVTLDHSVSPISRIRVAFRTRLYRSILESLGSLLIQPHRIAQARALDRLQSVPDPDAKCVATPLHGAQAPMI